MSLKLFDDDSDIDCAITVNEQFASKYQHEREREELQRLQAKYGDTAELSESEESSEEEDEDAVEITEDVEKSFYKTLSCLKNRDPKIYDNDTKFFEEKSQPSASSVPKKPKEKPIFLKDYEKKIVLEKGGKFSDSEEEDEREKEAEERAHSPTYVEEQKRIKDSLKQALQEVDDEEDKWGGMFEKRKKTEEELEQEEKDYLEWLCGRKDEIEDEDIKTELKPLREFWTDPNLSTTDKFLRDYVLNKRFLEKNKDYIPTYEEIVDEEKEIEKQENFEHKYNFRFEEPDQEFIKRYPRTMANSLRRVDDKRKVKRQETKERKKEEKLQKMEEIKQLKALKRKEIEEKIEKLKEITGNTDIGFNMDDFDGDFDPDAYDQRMNQLFNDEFYKGEESEFKPEFPDLDEELGINNWDKWTAENVNSFEDAGNEPHCEDPDFNMDCDYDPSAPKKTEESSSKKRRKRKKKFNDLIKVEKPKFDPEDTTLENYLDEYYQLDCEDIIGDLPCRFKYQETIPNDFGLTTAEILMADDRELNRWCSLKKIIQDREEQTEMYDKKAYSSRAQNEQLKRKLLPSLFAANESQAEAIDESQGGNAPNEPEERTSNQAANSPQSEKRKKRKRKSEIDESNGGKVPNEPEESTSSQAAIPPQSEKRKKRKRKSKAVSEDTSVAKKEKVVIPISKKKEDKTNFVASNKSNRQERKFNKNKPAKNQSQEGEISDARLKAYGINPKKFKNKLKYKNKEQ